jgi:hypothetical protein
LFHADALCPFVESPLQYDVLAESGLTAAVQMMKISVRMNQAV